MHFFRSREDAAIWKQGRGNVTILSISEGDELAQRHWVELELRDPAEMGELGGSLATKYA
jgi:hypothetical protein